MDNDTLIVLGLGVAGMFLLSKKVFAGTTTTYRAAGNSNYITKDLTAIVGAEWSIPLFLTLDRDLPLGFYGMETLFTVGTTLSNVVPTVGSAIGTALSTTNQIVSGTVIPAIINAAGTTATYIAEGASSMWGGLTTGAEYVGSGLGWLGGEVVELGGIAGQSIVSEVKALPGQLTNLGSNAWMYSKAAGGWLWNQITGAWEYVSNLYETSKVFANAVNGLSTLAAGITINKIANKSDNTTNSQKALEGDIAGPSDPQIIPIGYLSKTDFDDPKALIVRKMYNIKTMDTRIVTDNASYDACIKLGYVSRGILGYCAPDAFYGATNMISMYNAQIMDSIVITNFEIIPKLEKYGYKSLGTIGYCKALSHEKY